jgi:hypothetical protein
MHHFTPLPALLGGVIIGLSASLLLLTHGKIAGISGQLGGLLAQGPDHEPNRLWFLVGLVAAGFGLTIGLPSAFPTAPTLPLWAVALAGVTVGYGTRMGHGCTSGHGVCGISRLSARSLVATVTFMATGAATVLVTRHLLHLGAP